MSNKEGVRIFVKSFKVASHTRDFFRNINLYFRFRSTANTFLYNHQEYVSLVRTLLYVVLFPTQCYIFAVFKLCALNEVPILK